MPGPLARYQRRIERGDLLEDSAQAHVAQRLDERFQALCRISQRRWWPLSKTTPPKGIYLVGAVGRGKTLLMDLFAEALDAKGIGHWRIHFHPFMRFIQDELKNIEGQANPLHTIAKAIAKHHRVLCFDEFQVEDIGDAMILGELLHHLFAQGVVLITTSNTEPDQLYADGLQRARFVPAIEALKRHTDVVSLDASTDYRLRALTTANTYFYPLTEHTDAKLATLFESLTGQTPNAQAISIQNREITALAVAEAVAWFSFDVLCRSHRSTRDYIELANRFDTLLISGVPILSQDDGDATKRLMHLIDEAYDRKVKVVISANAPAHALYQGKRLEKSFARTASRLIEMQTQHYLQSEKSQAQIPTR